MRWTSWNHMKLGEYRKWRGFLWLPFSIGGECRWLEMATVEYQCMLWRGKISGDHYLRWVPIKFVD